jgi:hypothetical protein
MTDHTTICRARRLAVAALATGAVLAAAPSGALAAKTTQLHAALKLDHITGTGGVIHRGVVTGGHLGRGRVSTTATPVPGSGTKYTTSTTLRWSTGTIVLQGTIDVTYQPADKRLQMRGSGRIVRATGRFRAASGALKVRGHGPITLRSLSLLLTGRI